MFLTASISVTVSFTPRLSIPAEAQGNFDIDLSATSINYPLGIVEAGDVVVNATIMNVGNHSSGPFQANLTVFRTGLLVNMLSEDFESGTVPPVGWAMLGANWMTTTSEHQSGSRCLFANQGTLPFPCILESPAVDLPISIGLTPPGYLPPWGTQCSSILSFWAHYTDTGAGQSRLDVKVMKDSTEMVVFRGDTTGSGSGSLNTSWNHYSIDLKPFSGFTVNLRFCEYQYTMNSGDAIYLDNVSLTSMTGTEVFFTDSAAISNLDSNDTVFVEFSPWTATYGDEYTIWVNTYLQGDQEPLNDYATGNLEVLDPTIPEFGTMVILPIALILPLAFKMARRRSKMRY